MEETFNGIQEQRLIDNAIDMDTQCNVVTNTYKSFSITVRKI